MSREIYKSYQIQEPCQQLWGAYSVEAYPLDEEEGREKKRWRTPFLFAMRKEAAQAVTALKRLIDAVEEINQRLSVEEWQARFKQKGLL